MAVGKKLKNKFQFGRKRTFDGLKILLKTSPHPNPHPSGGYLSQVPKKSIWGILRVNKK